MHTLAVVDYDSLLVLADLRQAGTRTATWVFGSAKKSLSLSLTSPGGARGAPNTGPATVRASPENEPAGLSRFVGLPC